MARGMSIGPALIIVAHPDDEVIGAGWLLTRLRQPTIVQVTDGGPRGSPASYAVTREAEATRALSLARPDPVPRLTLGVRDQEASYRLSEIGERLVFIFNRVRPRFVVTHPFEGGHPDHDATACAVHWASAQSGVRVFEFTSYHWRGDHLARGEFLPNGGRVRTHVLTPAERKVKRAMLDAHVSQRRVLEDFTVERERYRPAPAYDFTARPHGGELFYEKFDWGVTGARWRDLANEFLSADSGRLRWPRGAVATRSDLARDPR